MEDPHCLFDRLTLRSSLGRTGAIFCSHWRFFLLLGTILYIPWVLFLHTFETLLITDAQDKGSQLETGEISVEEAQQDFSSELVQDVESHGGTMGLELFFDVFVGVCGQAVVSLSVAQVYCGQALNLSESFQRVSMVSCCLIGASLSVKVLLGVLYGTLLFATQMCKAADNPVFSLLGSLLSLARTCLSLYFSAAFTMVVPTVTIELLGPIEAIKRCWNLANEKKGLIVCTAFSLTFINEAAKIGAIVALYTIDSHIVWWKPAVGQSTNIIYVPLFTILMTVMYLGIRCEHEGLDRNVLENQLKDSSIDQYAILDLDLEEEDAGRYKPLEESVLL